VLKTTGEELLINSFIPETCPCCDSDSIKKDGYTNNGVQRYRCLNCGKKFTPVTGTIFDGHKISISEWMEYTLNILRYVSINADSWNNKNAYTTSRYWLEKLFIVLESQQAEIILSGRIWLDETYYTVELKDIELKEDGTKPRGLSKNQLCIGVACTDTKILCLFEGNGKPSKKKTYSAFKDHIAAGSTLVHDKEAAHSMLVEKLNLVSEVYDSKELKKLEDKDNPLKRVNEVHARLKNFLYAHNSFNRESLQGYLNLFTLAMNPPTDNLEKVELLLNSAFKTRKTLRYRDFYKVN
jgi:transposase-like protein